MKQGQIIKIISNLYTVLSDDKRYECRARGKFRNDKETPLVGDYVTFDSEKCYIMAIEKRKNELDRPSIANVNYALIVTSLKCPDLSLTLLDKELVCIYSANITPIICLSKSDLLTMEELTKYKEIFTYYQNLGIEVIYNTDLEKIKSLLSKKIVVLTGQTGSGKSTLLNKLDINLNLKTSPISLSLGRGVHTTRHTELYRIGDIFIADTPGFSALDVKCKKDELKLLLPEFKVLNCKYSDCNHLKENDCRVKELVDNGIILKSRYDNYVKFYNELK